MAAVVGPSHGLAGGIAGAGDGHARNTAAPRPRNLCRKSGRALNLGRTAPEAARRHRSYKVREYRSMPSCPSVPAWSAADDGSTVDLEHVGDGGQRDGNQIHESDRKQGRLVPALDHTRLLATDDADDGHGRYRPGDGLQVRAGGFLTPYVPRHQGGVGRAPLAGVAVLDQRHGGVVAGDVPPAGISRKGGTNCSRIFFRGLRTPFPSPRLLLRASASATGPAQLVLAVPPSTATRLANGGRLRPRGRG